MICCNILCGYKENLWKTMFVEGMEKMMHHGARHIKNLCDFATSACVVDGTMLVVGICSCFVHTFNFFFFEEKIKKTCFKKYENQIFGTLVRACLQLDISTHVNPMYTPCTPHVHPMYTPMYTPCTLMYTHVHSCTLMYTHVHPMYTYVHPCTPPCTPHVHPCIYMYSVHAYIL